MFNPKDLANLLRKLRRKSGISRNQLAKLTGLSRRTLGRIEDATRGSRSVIREKRTSLLHGPRDTGRGARPAGVSARTAYRLAKLLLGEEETERRMEDQTRLSRFLGKDPLYKFLDDLYHYPAFLFHRSAAETLSQTLSGAEGSAVEGPDSFRQYADDYRHTLDLLLRSGFGTRNLGARLRAFRMQHDLTLIETAALLDLSKSELHRLERAERRPSPRTRYRILRLLTLPLSSGHDSRPERSRRISRADTGVVPSVGEKRAALLRGQHAGRAGKRLGRVRPASPEQERGKRTRRVGNANPVYPERKRRVAAGIQPIARRASSEGSQACPEQGRGGNPRRVSPPPAGSHPPGLPASSPARRPSPSRAGTRAAWLAAARAALAVPPPPRSDAPSSAETLSGVERLRYLWLAGSLKTKELAAALGVSPPHLIRLLRGDRNPSRRLCEQLGRMTSRLRQSPH